jgi:two-component system CheB/CheR fusion protein
VLDLRLPGMGGLALLEHLSGQHMTMPAVVITGYADVAVTVRAMQCGAVTVIEKPIASDRLLGAIERAVRQGRERAESLSYDEAAAQRIADLTPREHQVMDMVVACLTNKEIAYRLGISQRTIENHRAKVMKNTGATSLAELIRLDYARQVRMQAHRKRGIAHGSVNSKVSCALRQVRPETLRRPCPFRRVGSCR